MSGVIVLNASYEELHVVSIPHAIRMLVREVAVVAVIAVALVVAALRLGHPRGRIPSVVPVALTLG